MDTCLDWIPEIYHPLGNGEAVIPDALLYYRRGGEGGSMLRAFLEVDRAAMGPERLAAKLTAYARLHDYVPTGSGGRGSGSSGHRRWSRGGAATPCSRGSCSSWTDRPRRIEARLHATTDEVAGLHSLLHAVPVLAAPLILRDGPSAPV